MSQLSELDLALVCSRRTQSSSLRRRANDTRAREDETKDGTLVVRSAPVGCPVEVPVTGLHQSCLWVRAVGDVEAVQCGQRAAWGDFEDDAIALGPAKIHRPVEVAAGGLYEPGDR